MAATTMGVAPGRPTQIRLSETPVFSIDRISFAAALGLLWILLFIPWFVVPQRFAVFGMDLLYKHSWIGGSNLPQRGLASLDRIIGQMKGGELWLVILATLVASAFAMLAILQPRWSRFLSFGMALGGLCGLAYYATFAPNLLLYGSVGLAFIASVMILMNVERGEIEVSAEFVAPHASHFRPQYHCLCLTVAPYLATKRTLRSTASAHLDERHSGPGDNLLASFFRVGGGRPGKQCDHSRCWILSRLAH